MDSILAKPGNSQWGITSVILRDDQRTLFDHMVAQDGLYTLLTLSSKGEKVYRVIGSIVGLLDGVRSPQSVSRACRNSLIANR